MQVSCSSRSTNSLWTRCLRVAQASTFALALGFLSAPAQADDSEIFITTGVQGAPSNLILVIDTSGSMLNTAVSSSTTVENTYNSTTTYSNSGSGCHKDSDNPGNYIYYDPNDPTGTTYGLKGGPKSCTGLVEINISNSSCTNSNCNQCAGAVTDLAFGTGNTSRAGFYSDYFIRFRGGTNSRTWSPTLASTGGDSPTDLECFRDDGVNGSSNSGSSKWPRSGLTNQTAGRWGTKAQSWWASDGQTGMSANKGLNVTFYSTNYIRFQRNARFVTTTVDQSRLDVVKQAAKTLLDSANVQNMNVGLMRYSTTGANSTNVDDSSKGGMVLWPALPLSQGNNKLTLKAKIDALVPAGTTPLSETLYEAQRYLSGSKVEYGKDSTSCVNYTGNVGDNGSCKSTNSPDVVATPSIDTSMTSDKNSYISPITASCQHSYIVYLTDGLPTSDGNSKQSDRIEARVEALTGYSGLKTKCTADDSANGACLGALSEYIHTVDQSSLDGLQTADVYYIGFGSDFKGDPDAFQYLADAAKVGGGAAFQANNLPELTGAFNSILATVAPTNTSFSAPTVAVNAFNRTRTLNDLFVSVFAPALKWHWPGNLKKYQLIDGVIKDSSTPAKDAVDATSGFFTTAAKSFWSAAADGADVTKGGAANKLPDPASRTIYTYINSTLVPSSMQNLTVFNATNVTTADLQIGNTGDPALTDLVNWTLGLDVRDQDPGDGDATETRHVMGDPMHTQPQIVIYGGTAAAPDAVVYTLTNDGYMHAFNASTGVELWAFIPQELLPRLKTLYANPDTNTKQYALDGQIRVLKFDVNGDGTVSGDDRVILFFSQGRGGSNYYALDVTDKNNPKYLWTMGASALPGIGQSWSEPTLARVNVSGASQNSQKLVLLFGGGYDIAEDGANWVGTDTVGNSVYMVDALKGTLLWSAGPSTSGANLKLSRMDHSIPSAITVLDTNSDGLADRMYVGDTAGQIWRFDIHNGMTAAGTGANALVSGGVIASLGAHETHADADARRFYYQPSVSLMDTRGLAGTLNIAIGSGYRGHPLNKVINDRVYSIRDTQTFANMTQAQFDALYTTAPAAPITEDNLQDVTTDPNATIPANKKGWLLKLGTGEKVLSEVTTFDNDLFFVSYIPGDTAAQQTNVCTTNSTGTGKNLSYVVNVVNASPVSNLHTSPTDPDTLTTDDRSTTLSQSGIASGVTFLFPADDANINSSHGRVVCLSGVEVLGVCTNFNSRMKTYWRETDAP